MMTIQYGWWDDDDTDWRYFNGDLPATPDTKESIVCPQCWDEKEYDGDAISEITKSMCKGIR